MKQENAERIKGSGVKFVQWAEAAIGHTPLLLGDASREWVMYRGDHTHQRKNTFSYGYAKRNRDYAENVEIGTGRQMPKFLA